jgi:serine/threonine protein kinase
MDMTCPAPYIVQEYVEGRDLGSFIQDKHFLDETAARRLLKEQADVLSYLHEQEIYHRDIKPENIMIDNTGRSRLMDFGLALSSDVTRMTADGNFVGTLRYCAPEVLEGKDGGSSSDIFQLGVVVYEAMTGEALVGEFTNLEEFVHMVFEARWETEELSDKISPKMSTLVKACTLSDSQKRIQDGRALLEYLDREFSMTSPEMQLPQGLALNGDFKAALKVDSKVSTRGSLKGDSRGPSKADSRTSSKGASKVGSNGDSTVALKAVSGILSSPIGEIDFARRKIRYGGALTVAVFFILFLYFFPAGKMDNLPENRSNEVNVSSLTDFSLIAREWLLLPKGFYIFFPAEAGSNLRWEFQPDVSENNKSVKLQEDFKKVAGGWKAFCSSVVKSGDVEKTGEPKGVLSFFDGPRLIARGDLGFPGSLLSEPFKVLFAYESIHCSWKLFGKMKASILFEELNTRGTVVKSLEISDLESKYSTSLRKLGLSGRMRLTLKVSGISKSGDTFNGGGNMVVDMEEGNTDFTLKCQLPLKDGEKYSGYQYFPNRDESNELQADIVSIVVLSDRVYVSTESAEIHCFKINADNESFYDHMWSKNLYKCLYPPGKTNDGETKEVQNLKLAMRRSAMAGYGDGVSLYGLNMDRQLHSFDSSGNYSTRKIPFPDGENSFIPVEVSVQGTCCFLNCSNYLDNRKFYLWEDQNSCKLVQSEDMDGNYSAMYGGLSTFFVWYSSGKKENIYYLKRDENKVSLELLGSFPSLKKENRFCFASEPGSDHALFSLKDALYLIRGKPRGEKEMPPRGLNGFYEGFKVERIPLNLPEKSGIGGIVSCGGGKYTVAFYSGLNEDVLIPTTVPSVNTLNISVFEEKVSTIVGAKKLKILKEANRTSFSGPFIINDHIYCFSAGATFCIMSREDETVLYTFDFYTPVRSINVGKAAIVVEANSAGLIYGLNLPPGN